MKALILYTLVVMLISSSVTDNVTDFTMETQDIPFNINIEKALREPKVINLSTFGSSLKYIPLETTPESLIKEIDQVEVSDSYIFVNDQDRLLEFDSKGKFLRQIGSQGRGPEEYLGLSDFSVDFEEKDIYILSQGKVLVFDFNGHFKRSYKLSMALSEFIFIDKNKLLYHLFNLPGQSDGILNSWIITDKQGVVLTSIKSYLMRKNKPGLIVGDTPIYKYDNSVHFMEFGIDTLYYFQGAQRKVYAIFNLGKYKMNADPQINASTAKSLSDKVWINSIYEIDEYIFINLFCGLGDSSIYVLYNKETSNTCMIKENGFRNDIDQGLVFWPKLVLANNILVDYVNGFDLLKRIRSMQIKGSIEQVGEKSRQLLNLEKQITETSNPILILLQR